MMIDYFKKLFEASNTDREMVINCMLDKISSDQNSILKAEVEESKVKKALFHMHPEKSPGPDGMSPRFYQNFWNIVGNDVVPFMKRFSENGILDIELQSINIVLIPKKKNLVFMTDLRHISLCNEIYKVISKVLANRLKRVLGLVILDNQSAFI